MRSPITLHIKNRGFLTVEIIIAFSFFILFTVSAYTLDSSMNELKNWSIKRLAYIKQSIDNLNTSTSTIQYGNDSVIINSGTISITKSDFINSFGQDSCSPRINFDKNNAQLFTPNINLGSNNISTDIVARNSIVYLSSNASSQSLPDLFIFNAENPNNPIQISSLNTGPGISTLTVAGPYIYTANQSTVAQMQIVDIHNRTNPILLAELKLPLPEASTTPTIGKSIFYRNGYIYFGTAKWNGPEFYIIDISNPTKPVIEGSFETNTLINDIYVDGDIAYLATSDELQMRVLDISNKNNPILINSFSPSGSQTQEGKVLNYFERVLSLGRTTGGFNVLQNHEAFIFSTSSSLNITNSLDMPGGVYGMLNRNPYIYLLTHSIGSELQIFTSNLKNKIFTQNISSTTPTAMACDWSNLYFATGDNHGFSILKLNNL
jgi:hypothetical protein